MKNNIMEYIGTYQDTIIGKQYKLYVIDAKVLSDALKDNYSKFHNIPNIEDFKKSSENDSDLDLLKYENNFISLLTADGTLDSLNGAVLIDGYRRLFMSTVPIIDIFAKVYNSSEITIQDEVKLMMEFNYWKKFNKERSSFFERGFSLWIFLKNGVDIATILEELQWYLHYREFFEDRGSDYFDTLFFDNVNLFDDIKFIHELKQRKVSFKINKKEYKDYNCAIPRSYIEKLGKLRHADKVYNKINIDKFYTDILEIEAFKELLVEYNEAKIHDKKVRCLEKSLDFLMGYTKSEYFGYKKEKTVIELQLENKKILNDLKKSYSLVKAIGEYSSSRSYGNYNVDLYIQNLYDEIKDAENIIWVQGSNMKGLNAILHVNTLKFLEIKEKTNNDRKFKVFIFEDIDTKEKYEWSLGSMSKYKLYIPSKNVVREVKKRPEFVIYSIQSYTGRGGGYLIKAKNKKRVVEIANENGRNVNYSYITNYCSDLTTHEKALEATKDIEEGIIEWKN